MTNDSIADMLTRIRNANRINKATVRIPKTKMTLSIAQILQDEGFIQSILIGAKEVSFSDEVNMDTDTDEVDTEEEGFYNAKKITQLLETGKREKFFTIVFKTAIKKRKNDTKNYPVLVNLKKISKPGCRIYVNLTTMPKVLGGIGIAILSTSKGIMPEREALEKKVGGEVLCYVY